MRTSQKLTHIFIFGLSIAGAASASPVPPATYTASAVGGNFVFNSLVAASADGFSPDHSVHSTANAGGGFDPTATATVDASPGKFAGGASANVHYFFTIAGPPGIVPVLLHVKGSAPAFTPAQLVLFGDNAVAKVTSDIGSATTDGLHGQTTFDVVLHGSINPGQVIAVDVLATFASGGDGFSGTATVDPLPQIDPAFGSASLYSVIFSDGLIPVQTVPLPGGFLLMGSVLVGARRLSKIRRRIAKR